MGDEYVEGWFHNKDLRTELNILYQEPLIFLTEFLSNEKITKYVYDIHSTSEDFIKDIAPYESDGRLPENRTDV